MNKDLKSFSKWLNANKISLNITKTEVLIFKPKGRVFKLTLKLKLCGKKLFTSNSAHTLQFYINKHCLKLIKANAMLCKICHYVMRLH